MTKITFNKNNIGMKGTVEFELLQEYQKDLDNAKALLLVMEKRYNDLYEEISCGYEVPQAIRHKVAIMQSAKED